MGQIRFRLLLLVVIFLLVQSGWAQTDSLNISWDRNSETDMSHYELWRALSDTDTNFNIGEYSIFNNNIPQILASIDTIVRTVDKSGSILPGYFISYMVVAVDSEGLRSEFSEQKGKGLPEIRWQRAEIDSGVPTTIPFSEFLWDLDTPLSQLTFTITQISHLDTSIETTNLLLTPNPITYTGAAGFVLSVNDPDGFWDQKTINLVIIPRDTSNQNNVPHAENDYATTDQNVSIDINPLINDSDSDGDSIYVVAPFPRLPQNGTVVLLDGSTIRYTPDVDYTGQDNFDYQISDGRGGRDTATVYITILPPSPPVLIVFPNPIKLSSGQSIIVFKGIKSEAEELWLISPAGNIIYKKSFSSAPPPRLELSLQDANLKELSSGFYIYLIKGKGDKKLESGKIAIIR